jgi:hypothetical protein
MSPAVTLILVSTGRSCGGGNLWAGPTIAVSLPDDENIPVQWHRIAVNCDWIALLLNEGDWYSLIESDNDP